MPEKKHPISHGDTLGKIARQYGIKNHEDLRSYHNQKVPLTDLMGSDSNFNNGGKLSYVLIPPQEEIDRMNAQGAYVPTKEDTPTQEPAGAAQDTPAQEEEEQEQSNSGQASEHDQKYVVIQQGQCVCDQSNPPNQVPVSMKVTSHTLQHANGDTANHLIVTEDDTQFSKPAQPFGPQCLKQPNGSSYNPCSYSAAGKWQKTYEKMKVMDKAVVTELSELMCVMGGKITILEHGQTQEVIAEHFENITQEELLLISPLAEKPEPGKEIHKVKSIKAVGVESKKTVNSSTQSKPVQKNDKLDNRGDGVNELQIRAGETVTFEVTGWWNATKADKSLTNWEVLRTDGKSPDWNNTIYDVREQVGSTHEELFHVPGFYRVFAYGNADTKWDNRCAIDVEVIENKLDESKKGIKVTGGNVAENLIRRGVPVVFQPAFLMEPLAEEKEKVQLWATDEAGNQLEAEYSPATGLSITPENHGQKINVHVSYTTLTGKQQQFSKEFKSVNNSVMEVKPVPESTVYRLGTTINFKATKMKFSTRINDTIEREEWARIKWNVNGQTQAGQVGRSFSFTPIQKKKYVVEAWVNSADAKLGKDDSQLDDWHFTVTDNKPTGFKGGNKASWVVGKWYTIAIETLMPYDEQQDGTIKWKSLLTGLIELKEANGTTVKVRAIKPIPLPLAAVSATIKGQSKILLASANLAPIKRWCITDKDLDFKSDAGWGEELYALVESTPLLSGEKIHLHLLEYDSSTDSNYIKDLGEVTFDEKGIAKAKFTTDGIKPELNKLYFEDGDYELFFAAEVKNDGIQFDEVTTKNRGGKNTIYPSKTLSHSELEKAKFTYIDSQKDITNVRFLKPNGKDAYEVIKYGEKITLKVQTRNLNGTELNLKNILKNNLGAGIKEYPQNVKVKVANETAKWDLNTGNWRKWAKDKSGVALYQVELEEADGDKVKYPNEKARLKDGKLDWQKLITYQSLKLSDNTTLSELAKTNAPLIIGEPLEVEQTHENGKCPRCGVLTMEELNQIFTSASASDRKKVVDAFNEGNLKYEIDTCLKKSHFFAQVLQEVGISLKLNEPESFNYSARRLKDGDYVSGSGWVNGNKTTEEGGYYTSGTWKSSPFSYFKTHHSEANKYGRKDLYSYNDKGIQAANSKKIANIVYADKNRLEKYKLGNIYEGDGWKYMGKGIIQVTGRTNYTEVNKRLERKGFNFDIVNNPDILLKHREGVLASMAYWYWKDLQIKSEKGQTKKIVDSITNIVNEGTDTHQKRWGNFVKLLTVFKVNECEKGINSTNENNTPCKDDYSKCTSYADVWDNPVISSDNGGKNNNRYGHGSTRGHKGLDVLSGSTYKEVHSTMCGEVTAVVDTFITNEYRKSSLGNTVMIKSNDKNGSTVFMLYCHLDKVYVKKGDKVCHGQKIALSGSTGNAAEILDEKGNLKNGIRKENWHVHIEAATKGEGYNNFYSLGSYRIQPEDYMKTKFDENGDPIK